MAIFWMMLMSK